MTDTTLSSEDVDIAGRDGLVEEGMMVEMDMDMDMEMDMHMEMEVEMEVEVEVVEEMEGEAEAEAEMEEEVSHTSTVIANKIQKYYSHPHLSNTIQI